MNKETFKINVIIFFWFVLLLFIPFSGHRYSNDSTAKYETARAFINTGSFNIESSETGWGRKNSVGEVYTYFTFGSVLLMFPAAIFAELLQVVIGKEISEEIVSFIVTFQNLVISSVIGLFLFLLFKLHLYTNREAFYYSNIIVVGSQMLQYSSTGWSEPGAFLFSFIGFYFVNLKTKKWELWALFSALAILVRIEYSIYVVLFLIFNLYKKKINKKELFKVIILFIIVLSFQLLFNFVRYRNVLDFGYFSLTKGNVSKAGYSLSPISRYLRSFYYSYLSFGRLHIFWVSPLILLNVMIPIHWKHLPQIIRTTYLTTIFVLIIIPFAGYNSWCWGNRYLYLYFPYLLISLFFIKDITRMIWFKILLVLSLVVSLLSTLVNSHVVQEILSIKYGPQKSIEITAANILNGTFWQHLNLFPKQLLNTFNLVINFPNDRSWEWFRLNCMDIWPVGLSSFINNAYIPFFVWVFIIGIVFIYYNKFIKYVIFNNAI